MANLLSKTTVWNMLSNSDRFSIRMERLIGRDLFRWSSGTEYTMAVTLNEIDEGAVNLRVVTILDGIYNGFLAERMHETYEKIRVGFHRRENQGILPFLRISWNCLPLRGRSRAELKGLWRDRLTVTRGQLPSSVAMHSEPSAYRGRWEHAFDTTSCPKDGDNLWTDWVVAGPGDWMLKLCAHIFCSERYLFRREGEAGHFVHVGTIDPDTEQIQGLSRAVGPGMTLPTPSIRNAMIHDRWPGACHHPRFALASATVLQKCRLDIQGCLRCHEAQVTAHENAEPESCRILVHVDGRTSTVMIRDREVISIIDPLVDEVMDLMTPDP